ncbi:MAG: hypothetical protein JWN52_6594 [Actinomycetia bacterium]|nr:hypothetical protein [Actinomycetes bacterium]
MSRSGTGPGRPVTSGGNAGTRMEPGPACWSTCRSRTPRSGPWTWRWSPSSLASPALTSTPLGLGKRGPERDRSNRMITKAGSAPRRWVARAAGSPPRCTWSSTGGVCFHLTAGVNDSTVFEQVIEQIPRRTPTRLRQGPLQAPQPGRTLLQQSQAVPCHRRPLRQTRQPL